MFASIFFAAAPLNPTKLNDLVFGVGHLRTLKATGDAGTWTMVNDITDPTNLRRVESLKKFAAAVNGTPAPHSLVQSREVPKIPATKAFLRQARANAADQERYGEAYLKLRVGNLRMSGVGLRGHRGPPHKYQARKVPVPNRTSQFCPFMRRCAGQTHTNTGPVCGCPDAHVDMGAMSRAFNATSDFQCRGPP